MRGVNGAEFKCTRVKARAYCSSANLGTGFDIIAVALDAFYDEVELEIHSGLGSVKLKSVEGPYASSVLEPNTAVEALKTIVEDLSLPVDISVKLWKGVPVGYGLGSSGASAVAAVRALIDALGLEVSVEKAIEYAGLGEKASAGEPHYDNVAASMLGGLVILHSNKPPIKVSKIRTDAVFVVGVPLIKVPPRKTELMRSILPKTIDLRTHVSASAKLAALLLGLIEKSWDLVALGTEDEIVEPARSKYIPCYFKVKEYAKKVGAVNTVISGAGPSLLSIVDNASRAKIVAEAMAKAYKENGIESLIKITRPAHGAKVIELEVMRY